MAKLQATTACATGSACGVGLLGVLCPFCIPAVATFLASIGLAAFATIHAVWIAMGILGTVFLVGMACDLRRHHRISPLLIGVGGLLAIVIERNTLSGFTLTYLGAAGIVAAAVWNIILCKRSTSPPPSSPLPHSPTP